MITQILPGMLRGATGGLVALLLGACATQTAPVKITSTVTPETTYRQITPKDMPRYTLQSSVNSVEMPQPKAKHFASPEYPPSLAHSGIPVVRINAQLVFDTEGHVKDTIILSNSYTGAGSEMFANAVKEATAKWAFTPLVFNNVTGGGDAPFIVTPDAKPFSLWFQFEFRMINGKPFVSTSK